MVSDFPAPPPGQAHDTDYETRRNALMAMCKVYERRGVDDPKGCIEVIRALGLGDIADDIAARKRAKDRRRRMAG